MKQQPWDGMNPKDGPQITPDLRVHAIPIDSIRPQTTNPRLGDIPVLRGSLRLFGQRQVATYQPDGEINVHSHLWMAAKAEGMTHFAAILIRDDDNATAHAWGLAENRTHDVGSYNDQLLDDELERLARHAPDLLTAAGFDADAVIADMHLDELDLVDDDDPLLVPHLPQHDMVAPPAPRPVQPHQLDRIPEDDVTRDETGQPERWPVRQPPPPTEPDSRQDIPQDKTGPNIADPPISTAHVVHPEPDMPLDDSPVVLFHIGDLRALVDRDAWVAWRAEMLTACDDDRVDAGRNAALLLGFPPDGVHLHHDPLPPLDRHR